MDEVEKRVSQLSNIIKELRYRLDLLQNTRKSVDIEPLSLQRSVQRNIMTKVDINKRSLPTPQKLTFNEVLNQGDKGVTAEQVAQCTGRSKNLESSYLHKLFENGYIKRKRIGRRVYYYPS